MKSFEMPPWTRYLPPTDLNVFERPAILKRLIEAKSALSRLDGYLVGIPNQAILITALNLHEAKDSSEIENIVTTLDDIFRLDLEPETFDPAAKEVKDYSVALMAGFDRIRKNGIIRLDDLLEIQALVKGDNEGIRSRPGTVIANPGEGTVVHVPPQDKETILSLLDNLLQFMNDDSLMNLDPLIKMAIFHSQFEAIHPFFDGNGRTGRILNILYLVLKEQLQFPVLYLSRYIIQYKSEYYRLLKDVGNNEHWEEWVLFILNAVLHTSKSTLKTVERIRGQMQQSKSLLREILGKKYSVELLNHLYRNPYTTIQSLSNELQINEKTARGYLEKLLERGIFERIKVKQRYYYLNRPLLELLREY